MTVFISYSHRDKAFVDRLSLALLDRNIKIWRDEYKLLAGDPLTLKIRGAIERASFLCVVLSESGVASTWVQREIEAGLLRESEASGLTIIPLVVADCVLPEPLRDRLFVDFRPGFEPGLARLMAAVKGHYAVDGSTGTTEDAAYFFYYGVEQALVDGRSHLRLDVVSFDREERFCLLTQVRFRGNEVATEEGLRARGIESVKKHLIAACADEFAANPARVSVSAAKPAHGRFSVEGADGLRFDATMEIRMLGEQRGESVVFNFGALFAQISATAGSAAKNREGLATSDPTHAEGP